MSTDSTKHSDIPQDRRSEELGTRELSMDETLVKQLVELVEANLDNEHLSVEDLAQELAISRSHLHRKLQKLRGKSISQFVREIRLKHAYDLLKAEVGTVSEIAYRVGFNSNTYFIKCFSEAYGFSPGEVKRRSVSKEDPVNEAIETDETLVSKQTPLESLHPASSESLILEIFTEVANHKRSLQKFLLVDEDEGEALDSRLLAYQLIKAFPWPIGVELRRLFSASLKNAEASRYEQLNKTILRTLKLVAYILISDVARFVKNEPKAVSSKLTNIIKEALKEISPRNIKTLLEEMSQLIQATDTTLFVTEFNLCFDDLLFREISDWVDDNSGNTTSAIEEACASLEQVLILMLKRFSFLAGYKLVHVSGIEVRKRKFDLDAHFQHKLQILNSIDSEFAELSEITPQYADNHSVILMKSIKETSEFLNLSPFIVDTHGAIIKSAEAHTLKRDIFLFDRYENNNLKFYGSELNSTESLSYLEQYDDLVAEYNEMIKIFSHEK
jgi:AraC-like DNA-binding protein